MLTRRGLLALALPALAAIAGAAAGQAALAFASANAALVGFVLADWLRARAVRVEGERVVAGPFSIGRENPVELRIRASGTDRARVDLADAPPADTSLAPLAHRLELAAGEERALRLVLVPRRRGPVAFPAVGARISGPLGLAFCQRRLTATAVQGVTWPDVLQLRDARLLPPGRRHGGMRPARGDARGREFESLRPYVAGDEFRRIAWMATARRGQPIIANLQPERRQTLLLCVEAGRLMIGGGADGLDKLDRAVNAAVMLGAVARELDDLVGATVFADEARAGVRPAAGRDQVRRIVELLADVQARPVEPDWRAALAGIGTLVSRRAVVILFSDVLYAETDPALAARLATLARRHAVILASIADDDLTTAARAPIEDARGLYQAGAAQALLNRRHDALTRLRRQGIHAFDAAPRELTERVVGEFRRLRRAGIS